MDRLAAICLCCVLMGTVVAPVSAAPGETPKSTAFLYQPEAGVLADTTGAEFGDATLRCPAGR